MASEHRNFRREFTLAMWDKWHADRKPDAHTLVLREGIRQFRAALDLRDWHAEQRQFRAALQRRA
jgi:hypothetical protein